MKLFLCNLYQNGEHYYLITCSNKQRKRLNNLTHVCNGELFKFHNLRLNSHEFNGLDVMVPPYFSYIITISLIHSSSDKFSPTQQLTFF